MEDEKRKFKPIGKTKKELVKKDIQGLKTVSQKEFNRIVDNLYSPEINFKDIPNVVLLPNLKKKLKKLLGITGNLYFTKRRFAHTNPVTKAKHSNQNFRIEEYKGILKWIKNSTYAIRENGICYRTFMLTKLDAEDNSKVNVLLFNEDELGNFVVTLKKIEVKALINKNYELVGAGVEPAISLALSKRPTTLTSSATNSDKTITSMEESVNNNLGRTE
ncbi:MAG: hypothetical protein IKX50_00365 [Spirochaetia bacterium]|nr:hypothetical protein [Spirochaetia bacterium]